MERRNYSMKSECIFKKKQQFSFEHYNSLFYLPIQIKPPPKKKVALVYPKPQFLKKTAAKQLNLKLY